jgi:alpha-1,6-mannosyltransferase
VITSSALTVLAPHGWGWVGALNTPTLGYTSGAPASLIGALYRPIVKPASFDDLAAAGRTTALLAAGCIVAYLTLTAGRRALEATVGLGLIAVALLSPVIYPWYFLWGALCLAPIARAGRRDLIVIICAIGAMSAVPGLPRVPADIVTVASAASIVAIVGRPHARKIRMSGPLWARPTSGSST